MPLVGDVLVGRYRIDAPLGAGGSAMVYRAHDLRLRRDVALKILLPNLASDSAIAQRFEREAGSLAAVNHPEIVGVYDVEAMDPHSGREPFFVMELCEGGSLAGLLSARGGRLAPDEVVPAIVDIAGGLASLHARGFVHRDVKPHNILLTSGGAKLGDFGIARTGDSTSAFTAPGTAVGTLAYLAPELLAGGEATRAADVFALGVVVYQALTGQLPRPAGSVLEFVTAQGSPIAPPSEIRPELGTFFDAPMAAALGSDPADRPAPMTFASALQVATGDWRRSGRGSGPPPPLPRPPAQSPAQSSANASATSVRDGRRPIRLAPPDPAPPTAGRTATVLVRTVRPPPPGSGLPERPRSWTEPLVAALMLVALIALVGFVLFDGARLFGGTASGPTPSPSRGPSASPGSSPSAPASASPTPTPRPSPSASPSPSPTPSPTPSPSPAPTPPVTPGPTAPPRPTPTQIRIVDPATARSASSNIDTAIANLIGRGQISANAARELRSYLFAIDQWLQVQAYEDAAIDAEALELRIEELIEADEMARSAELLQEVDKLRSALPIPPATD